MALVALILLSALVGHVLGSSEFIQPPPDGPLYKFQDNSVYTVGQKIDISWKTDLERVTVELYEYYPGDARSAKYLGILLNNSTVTSIVWEVSLGRTTRTPSKGQFNVLYLTLSSALGTRATDAKSHMFNVTVPDTASTTSSTSTSTSTSTTSSVGSATSTAGTGTTATSANVATVTATTTATSEPQTPGDSDPGLSGGALAGAAAGGIVGGILILGGIGVLAWRKSRKSRQMKEGDTGERPDKPPAVVDADVKLPEELGSSDIHEAPSTPCQVTQPEPIYEMPETTSIRAQPSRQEPLHEAP